MTIVDDLTPTQYRLLRFAVRIENGELALYSDIAVYNAAGKQVGTDHPTPQATAGQLAAFTEWIESNLALYETATGLTELAGEE